MLNTVLERESYLTTEPISLFATVGQPLSNCAFRHPIELAVKLSDLRLLFGV